jgi:dienelactone hydrolase
MNMVRVLARRFTEHLHGPGRPFSRFARAGMARAGHIPAQEKLRQLQTLGAHLYACGRSMQHFNVANARLGLRRRDHCGVPDLHRGHGPRRHQRVRPIAIPDHDVKEYPQAGHAFFNDHRRKDPWHVLYLVLGHLPVAAGYVSAYHEPSAADAVGHARGVTPPAMINPPGGMQCLGPGCRACPRVTEMVAP